MLSYRHAFHAGNHADVLKHLILTLLLDYLTRKDKPLWYVDTHAGAGIYQLDDALTANHSEAATGILRLWHASDLPPALTRYLELVKAINPQDDLIRYPGSSWFASRLLRHIDQSWLYELHPADHATLSLAVGGGSTHIERGDGFQALRALLPPKPRRALVLIDPSYEVKTDYVQVLEALQDSLRRFPSGVYALWLPHLGSAPAQQLADRLQQLGLQRWLHASLDVRAQGMGMHGSSMFVVNPPHTLPAILEENLPTLVELLGQDASACYELEWRIP